MARAPRRGRVNLLCQHCGKTYNVVASRQHHSKYCSKECQDNAASLGETRACLICGTSFYVPRWKIEKDVGHYCSSECFGKASRKRIEAKCIQCHHTYIIIESKQDATRFCSRECQATWQSENWTGSNSPHWGGREQECAWCGKIYLVGKWKADNGLSRFCSRECYGRWRSQELCGENSNQWKGGRAEYYGPNWYKQRAKARRRDKFTCQRCGIHQQDCDQALSVHHIKPFCEFGYVPGENENYREANRLDNLVSFCQPCHMQEEHALA